MNKFLTRLVNHYITSVGLVLCHNN